MLSRVRLLEIAVGSFALAACQRAASAPEGAARANAPPVSSSAGRGASAPSAASPSSTTSEPAGLACVGKGPVAAAPGATSVAGGPLATCPAASATGYRRDGYCAYDAEDRGAHVVCARVTEGFLRFTASRGNDLVTPRGSFPGLRAGDAWCLCAGRWQEAYEAGVAPPVLLEATEVSALRTVEKRALVERSAASR